MIPIIVWGLEAAAPLIVELAKEGRARAEAAHIEWERERAIWAREEAQRRRERQIAESGKQLANIIDA